METGSGCDVHVIEWRSFARAGVPLDYFHAVVIHYSVVLIYLARRAEIASRIAKYKGVKIAFIQDEYRWINQTVSAITELGIGVLFSVSNNDIYTDAGLRNVRIEQTLTGFVSDTLCKRQVPALRDRPIDVGYRGRAVPAWLGKFAQEEKIIGDRVLAVAKKHNLNVDISSSENDRIYGEKWIKFLSSCRSVLGTESGASICDFTGDIQKSVEEYERKRPGASFEAIHEDLLKKHDGNAVISVISPRCFEAAALRTLMILYPGAYSGILEPHRHYVPLAKDHSNIADVIDVLRDDAKAQKIVDAAYREVACNPANSFHAFAAHFDRVFHDEMAKRETVMRSPQRSSSVRARFAVAQLHYKWTYLAKKTLSPLVVLIVNARPAYASGFLKEHGRRVLGFLGLYEKQ